MGKRKIKLRISISSLLIFLIADFAKIAAANTPHVLFLGDSLGDGYGVPIEKSFTKLFEKNLLEKNKPIKLYNGSVSGATTASATERLRWYLPKKPTHLILELGGNDFLRGLSIEQTKNNLDTVLVVAKQEKIRVFLLAMRVPANYGKKYIQDFENIYPALAKKYSIPWNKTWMEGVAGVPTMNLSDGIHPSEAGHQLIAKHLTRILLPWLKF